MIICVNYWCSTVLPYIRPWALGHQQEDSGTACLNIANDYLDGVIDYLMLMI